jgi:hypothetical protein
MLTGPRELVPLSEPCIRRRRRREHPIDRLVGHDFVDAPAAQVAPPW